MGHKQSKQEATQPDLDDQIMDMKLAGRQMANTAKRAGKQQQKEIGKARNALKKNDEEGAKLYLQNAANKYKEGQNMNKMANRMDAIGANIKANNNNMELMNNLNRITPMLLQQGKMMNPEAMSNDMRQYQSAMDNLEIGGRIMNANLNDQNYDQSSNAAVDSMLADLKKELAMDINSNLSKNPDLIYNNVMNNQQREVNVLGKR